MERQGLSFAFLGLDLYTVRDHARTLCCLFAIGQVEIGDRFCVESNGQTTFVPLKSHVDCSSVTGSPLPPWN